MLRIETVPCLISADSCGVALELLSQVQVTNGPEMVGQATRIHVATKEFLVQIESWRVQEKNNIEFDRLMALSDEEFNAEQQAETLEWEQIRAAREAPRP